MIWSWFAGFVQSVRDDLLKVKSSGPSKIWVAVAEPAARVIAAAVKVVFICISSSEVLVRGFALRQQIPELGRVGRECGWWVAGTTLCLFDSNRMEW